MISTEFDLKIGLTFMMLPVLCLLISVYLSMQQTLLAFDMYMMLAGTVTYLAGLYLVVDAYKENGKNGK